MSERTASVDRDLAETLRADAAKRLREQISAALRQERETRERVIQDAWKLILSQPALFEKKREKTLATFEAVYGTTLVDEALDLRDANDDLDALMSESLRLPNEEDVLRSPATTTVTAIAAATSTSPPRPTRTTNIPTPTQILSPGKEKEIVVAAKRRANQPTVSGAQTPAPGTKKVTVCRAAPLPRMPVTTPLWGAYPAVVLSANTYSHTPGQPQAEPSVGRA